MTEIERPLAQFSQDQLQEEINNRELELYESMSEKQLRTMRRKAVAAVPLGMGIDFGVNSGILVGLDFLQSSIFDHQSITFDHLVNDGFYALLFTGINVIHRVTRARNNVKFYDGLLSKKTRPGQKQPTQ